MAVVVVKVKVASQYLIRVQSGEGRRMMELCRRSLLYTVMSWGKVGKEKQVG